ncbi:hypothetical protein ACFC14_16505 [Microbacterium sp. NPDC055988]|uniref:hypothetical protein n=1 Tax=Microbacterium sp. NPDC055988 TaxID=3345671 RepID=UPI0035E237BA
MSRVVAILGIVAALAQFSDDTEAPGFSDFLAGTDGSAVTVMAHEHRPNDAVPEPNSPERRGATDKPKPCTTDPVRQASCNITAERVTNDEGRPLTITDVAQFAPAPATTVGEPGNVGIAGMPANFVAAASVHTRAGTLFDRPTRVRFTPVRFSFTYGDGATTTTNTGGRSWAALGQAQFTPTSTSHSYRERGTYSAHVTVHYTAEVDIGGGWFPIDGELSIDGPARQIRVYEAETALVARTCAEQPGAPGC